MHVQNEKLDAPLLLFDHECSLCVRFKDSLKKINIDQQINMISLHDENVYKRYPFLKKKECIESIHLVLGETQEDVLVGEKVIEYLVTLNPIIKKFSWLVESKMGQKAIGFFHSAVSNYRESLLNRCTGCRNKH